MVVIIVQMSGTIVRQITVLTLLLIIILLLLLFILFSTTTIITTTMINSPHFLPTSYHQIRATPTIHLLTIPITTTAYL